MKNKEELLKVLIIPDIHNKIAETDEIIDKENPDKIVFLGDYFDSYDDTLEMTEQTAQWLKKSIETPNRIHLVGNHDFSYIKPEYPCSGFSEGKLWAIRKTGVDLTQLKFYCFVDDWLCTHAGLTKSFMFAYEKYETQPINEFLDDMIDNYEYRLLNCSPYRGGNDAHSGILWCDYDEFKPFPNVKQIFGHTHGDIRFKDDNNICLDTWLKYYAVYENGVMTVIKNE